MELGTQQLKLCHLAQKCQCSQRPYQASAYFAWVSDYFVY